MTLDGGYILYASFPPLSGPDLDEAAMRVEAKVDATLENKPEELPLRGVSIVEASIIFKLVPQELVDEKLTWLMMMEPVVYAEPDAMMYVGKGSEVQEELGKLGYSTTTFTRGSNTYVFSTAEAFGEVMKPVSRECHEPLIVVRDEDNEAVAVGFRDGDEVDVFVDERVGWWLAGLDAEEAEARVRQMLGEAVEEDEKLRLMDVTCKGTSTYSPVVGASVATNEEEYRV